MTIDETLILKLEKLARLQLDSSERAALKKDLNEILEMVDKLQELDTDNVDPLIYLNDEKDKMRDDVVGGELGQEEALKNAPLQQDGYFKVPKVLKID